MCVWSHFAACVQSRYPHTKVVLELAAEVDACRKLMATMLLRLLRRDAQLPECLRYVSYLRRLDIFEESELRWHFLACRDCWFEDAVLGLADDVAASSAVGKSAPPGNSVYDQLMQLIDHIRVHGFQIITQYRAIFADDTSAADASWDSSGLLFGWATEKVSYLVS